MRPLADPSAWIQWMMPAEEKAIVRPSGDHVGLLPRRAAASGASPEPSADINEMVLASHVS
jgi:hypothetical protein